MDAYKLKLTTLQQEIFRLFCVKAGKKLNQRKIAQYLNVSPTAIGKALPKLKNHLKIVKDDTMNLNLVELNRENPKIIHFKKVENLKLLYEVGLDQKLREIYPGCTIVLIGSFARGEDLFNSDIDIIVIGTKKKSKIFPSLEKEVRVSTFNSFKEIHKELRENVCNGIILSGGIEL